MERFVRNTTPIGMVDDETIRLAELAGIKSIQCGHLNKIGGIVRIYVKGVYPGAHKCGTAVRARVVWWLNTGEVLKGCTYDVRHKDLNKTNDTFSNLEKIDHTVHSNNNNPKRCLVERNCLQCDKVFLIDSWRLREPRRGKFCSPECYRLFPKSLETRQKTATTVQRRYEEGAYSMNTRFTEAQDKRLVELYDEKKNGKLACWDIIVGIMNTEFPDRQPVFTNDGLRSRYKRIKDRNKPKLTIDEMPPALHPFARAD